MILFGDILRERFDVRGEDNVSGMPLRALTVLLVSFVIAESLELALHLRYCDEDLQKQYEGTTKGGRLESIGAFTSEQACDDGPSYITLIPHGCLM